MDGVNEEKVLRKNPGFLAWAFWWTNLSFPEPGNTAEEQVWGKGLLAKFFCKGLDRKYFRFRQPKGLSQPLNSALLAESSHRQKVNEMSLAVFQ